MLSSPSCNTQANTDVSVQDLDLAGNPERIQGALRQAKEYLKQAQQYVHVAQQTNKRRQHFEFSVGAPSLLELETPV